MNSLSDASRSVRVVELGTAGVPTSRHTQGQGCQATGFDASKADKEYVEELTGAFITT